MSGRSAANAIPQRLLFRRHQAAPGRRTIAVMAPSYGLERVTYVIPSDAHDYVRLSRIPFYRLERNGVFLEQTPVIVGPKVDLVHTFNHIVANRPFVVSAEMELPRYLFGAPAWQRRLGLRLLAARRCRGIWPLSEAARAFIVRRFEREGFAALAAKTQVFRGAVTPVPPGAGRVDYPTGGPLKLLFVGGDGLRKGLEPSLEAVRRLREGGVEAEITVVGVATAEGYAVPGAVFSTDRANALLAEPWVTHHVALDNGEIRRLMGCHDLFLLPTIDESLGWVVAEAAMSGTPTICTDIFALPELVIDGETGWTIPLPLDEDLRWIHLGRADARPAWDEAQRDITDRLTAILASIAGRREVVAERGARARAHVAGLYGVDVAGARLDRLYAQALA